MAEIKSIARLRGGDVEYIFAVGDIVCLDGEAKTIRYIEATNVGFDIYVGETLFATVGGPAVDVVYY